LEFIDHDNILIELKRKLDKVKRIKKEIFEPFGRILKVGNIGEEMIITSNLLLFPSTRV